MSGFKVLRSPYLSAKHMRAKCCQTHREFCIRLESGDDGWYMVYATKLDENASGDIFTESNEELKLGGGLYAGSDYACPYCGNKNIVRCGKCGCITCRDESKFFKCEYCSNTGEIYGKINSVYVEQAVLHYKKRG